ncbi:uncharacterized protein EI90DRAFT_1021098 [Cantharellus anzutake]|uniref:uncharacterized protein n=1 Tax=Cantharellus anzutake TaxID=1750568 RepID=UPI001904FE6D|nr:uncharacterized protein EI90DRAFT_1021098 [Cantharellus anzutake]KAF8331431.1 hypothetical protein EI90DRAFT_1021098 [Cantharellus anzutake]
MSGKNPLPFFSGRSKAKSPAPELFLLDPQPSHTSRSLLQAPRIDITSLQVTRDGEVGSHAVSPSSMSTPPSSSLLPRWVLRWRSPSPNRDKSTTQRAKLSTSPQSSPDNSRLSHSHIPSEVTANDTPSRFDPQAIYETSAVSAEQPRGDGPSLGVGSSSSAAAATGSHGDQKKTIIDAIKLLLQTSATALKLAPIPNLYQIPNTLLAWINTYEVGHGP